MRAELPSTPVLGVGCASCVALKADLRKAIRLREDIRASLDSHDGAAAYWRRVAGLLRRQLLDLTERYRRSIQDQAWMPTTTSAEHLIAQAARELAAVVDVASERDETRARVKRDLWDLWTALPDETLAKRRLWELWTQL